MGAACLAATAEAIRQVERELVAAPPGFGGFLPGAMWGDETIRRHRRGTRDEPSPENKS